jgi:hypothetical protein
MAGAEERERVLYILTIFDCGFFDWLNGSWFLGELCDFSLRSLRYFFAAEIAENIHRGRRELQVDC